MFKILTILVLLAVLYRLVFPPLPPGPKNNDQGAAAQKPENNDEYIDYEEID